MRKKSSMQNGGGYQQHRKPRYNSGRDGGGDRHHHHSGGNRPRRNYGAAREKYLQQARDALASGDRVLAENYLQHADHCYRMMMEEGVRPSNHAPQQQQSAAEGQPQHPSQHPAQDHSVEPMPVAGALPAFITNYGASAAPAAAPPVQNWEERDEA